MHECDALKIRITPSRTVRSLQRQIPEAWPEIEREGYAERLGRLLCSEGVASTRRFNNNDPEKQTRVTAHSPHSHHSTLTHEKTPAVVRWLTRKLNIYPALANEWLRWTCGPFSDQAASRLKISTQACSSRFFDRVLFFERTSSPRSVFPNSQLNLPQQ